MATSTSTTSAQRKPSAAIIWGSSTGYTEEVAVTLFQELQPYVGTIFDIDDIGVTDLSPFDILILGIPTWHIGQLQDSWALCFDDFDSLDLSGKRVALFGCGDADVYPETFQDAMGLLWLKLKARGATLFGLWPAEGYTFKASKALTPDGQHFVGLALDEHSQSELTEQRIQRWARQIRQELNRIEVEEPAAMEVAEGVLAQF